MADPSEYTSAKDILFLLLRIGRRSDSNIPWDKGLQPVINLPERLGGAGWQEQREGASWQCLRGWHLHRPGWEPLAVHELQLWMDWASGLRSVG